MCMLAYFPQIFIWLLYGYCYGYCMATVWLLYGYCLGDRQAAFEPAMGKRNDDNE